MNLIAMIGNAVNAPEMRTTQGGRAVATFRMAVSRPGNDQADFFDVVCWERQAEIAHEYIGKGRRVAVEGRLHHSTWETDGQRRSKVEIVASRIQLLGAKPQTPAPGPLSEEQDLLDADQLAEVVV